METSLFETVTAVLKNREITHKDVIRLVREETSKDAVNSEWAGLKLSTVVSTELSKVFPRLYRHQSLAIQKTLAGENVVIATRTSSGKSLIYSVAISEALVTAPGSTALLCYPQKALANDQAINLKRQVGAVMTAAGLTVSPHMIARYDGQTHDDEKRTIRAGVQVMLTNPEMLHLAVLAWHEKHWQRFLTNLKYIILDEAHDYRGTFGSNFALVLRRLRLLCERYGSKPQFIATSATIADPAEHLRQLTGQNFSIVDPTQDGSKQGPKQFWIAQSATHPMDLARGLMKELTEQNLTVLAFTQSRQAAERLTFDVGKADDEHNRIAVYRAGLSTEHRQKIENGLRDGTVRGVFSTSALELGIDIGALDVCICVGFPNTMMSLWQRAGRVGRAGKPGVVIMIPVERPIDAYYSTHPDKLLAREVEPLAINLKSRTLATWHYGCAFYEANRNIEAVSYTKLDPPLSTIAEEHQVKGKDEAGYHSDNIHRDYNLRAGGDVSYDLMLGEEKIGDISRSQLMRETPPNAIYLHAAKAYRVGTLLESRKLIRLTPEYSGNRTQALVQTLVKLQQCWRASESKTLRLEEGKLLVTERLVSLTEKSRDGTPVATIPGDQGLKANFFPTTGVVVSVPHPSKLMSGRTAVAKIAWNGMGTLLTGLLPTVLGPCDLGDFSIHSQWDDEEPKLYIYDEAYDGIDLTIQAFGRITELLEAALVRITDCECSEAAGCFKCVRNQFDDLPTDRSFTKQLLTALINQLRTDPLKITVERTAIDRMTTVPDEQPCPKCGFKNRLGNKFCGDCGTNLGA